MSKLKAVPCALTIAGSDSGGGAGVQADLKTFGALGIHGLTAITCLTAQNPRTVLGVQPASVKVLRQQLQAISDEFSPGAMKTGMLYSAALIRVAAEFAARHPKIPLVVDPVMVATSGARLLSRTAMSALKSRLIPLASVITPNLPEAEALTGQAIRTIEQQRKAARVLNERFGCAVVVKGGHLKGAAAADIFFDGSNEWLLTSPFLHGIKTHGTGCAFAAAITASLALGLTLPAAVMAAKEFITRAIAGSRSVGRHAVLWPA